MRSQCSAAVPVCVESGPVLQSDVKAHSHPLSQQLYPAAGLLLCFVHLYCSMTGQVQGRVCSCGCSRVDGLVVSHVAAASRVGVVAGGCDT